MILQEPNHDSFEWSVPVEPPITLRDWFAGQALAGWMATYSDTSEHPATLESSDTVYAENIAQSSYLIADAMIKAREAKP